MELGLNPGSAWPLFILLFATCIILHNSFANIRMHSVKETKFNVYSLLDEALILTQIYDGRLQPVFGSTVTPTH